MLKNDPFSIKNGSKRPRKFNLLQTHQIFKISPRRQLITKSGDVPRPEEDKHLIKNWGFPDQITRFYRDKGINQFFPWQIEALEQPDVLEKFHNLVYSAPTSAGKTMVSDVLLYKNILERKKKAIIILPFVSITVEKVESLKKMMSRIGVRIDKFSGNTNPKGGFAAVDVAVCTIEKANNMINRLIEDGNLSEVGLIVVDELHMLGDSNRGYLLELLLTKVLFHSKRSKGKDNLVQIVGMSATIPNLPDISRWLNARLYVTDFRPVPLLERIVQVVDGNGQAAVYQYQKDNQKEDFKMLSSIDTRELGIDHPDAALIYTSIETVINGYSALIFCPTKMQCEKFSRDIAFQIYEFGAGKKLSTPRCKEISQKIVSNIKQNTEKIVMLMDSLKKSSAGLDPQLQESVRFGVAFHHAGMSTDERSAVEEAFRNGVIRVLCSTTTLSAGVNLPARRVLITSPFNYRGDQLMDVITYRQMIGRAGRKGIDELGEAYTFCRSKDFDQAQLLVRSDIKPITSCLLRLRASASSSEDSNSSTLDQLTVVMSDNLKKAIIEIIANGTATNKTDVIEYCKCTFFNESFSSRLTEEEQKTGSHFESAIDQVFEYLTTNQLIYLNNNPDLQDDDVQAKVYVSNLGKAIVASGIFPDEGQFIQKELDRARNNLSLVNDLHLVYQVTPTYILNQLTHIDWRHYLDLWQKLSKGERLVGERVGIKPGYLVSRCSSTVNFKNADENEKYLIYKRFYASLALHDLIQEIPLSEVAKKYRIVKGQIQGLQQQAATFAGMLAIFCNRLGWFSMELLIDQFQPRLAFGVQRELIDLMRITFLPASVARSLYKNYPTLKDMVYERAEDIEKSIIHGIAFDKTEVMDPKTRLIFVPALEQHFTISDFAKKILDEAREIIQTEIGQILNFEVPESGSSSAASGIRISPIKVKTEIQTVADKFGAISSAPSEVESVKPIKTDDINIEDLFDDDLEFSFGATPNKQSRLERSLTSTPASVKTVELLKKDKSSKKLDFNIDQNDLLEAGSSKQLKPIEKEVFLEPLIQDCSKAAKLDNAKCIGSNSGYSSFGTTQEGKSSGIVEDYDELYDNMLTDLSWSEMLDKVMNASKNSSASTSNDKSTCSSKNTNLSTKNLSNDSTEQQYNELFDELTTNNLIISNRMGPSLPSQDSGAPVTNDLNITAASSYSLDDSEEYSSIFDKAQEDDQKKDPQVQETITTIVTTITATATTSTITTAAILNISDSSNSSFKFEEDITHDDINQLVQLSNQNNTIEPPELWDDGSSSSLSFFETFKNNHVNRLPECFQNTDILIDKLSLINVEAQDDLEALINLIGEDSLNLIVHFVVRPYSVPVPIVRKPVQRKSIIGFIETEPPKGLVIQDGNAIELVEMFITIFGDNTVYRIDSNEYFQLFIERFRNILSKIEPLFEDSSRSPFSIKSTSSDSPKFIRILSYDIKLALHLFARGFKLPLNALIRRVDWYDFNVAVWLLDPEAEHFKISESSIQDLIKLSLVHSLDQTFVQKIRLYELSHERQQTPNTSSSKRRFNRRKVNEDTPRTGMIKTVLLSNLMNLFLNKLIDKGLFKSYKMIEIPSRILFAVMEMRGIRINEILLQFENKRIRKFLSYLERRIFSLVGQKFNIGSPDQVAKVLFQDQGLLSNYFQVTQVASNSKIIPPNKRSPKLFSTNKLALYKLQEACGTKTILPTLIIEWRRLNHSLTQCIHQIKNALTDNDLLFCKLYEWTATGRISMYEPNLINVDKDYEIKHISADIGKRLLEIDSDDDSCELDKSIDYSPTKISPTGSRPIKIRLRRTIVARDGYCLISADYRQLELRILAHFAKDQQLLSTLNDSSDDVFRCIASSWLKVDPDQVTYEARQQAKQICYGVIYGMGDRSLAEALAVSKEEATQFRLSFMQKYSSIQDFIEKTVESCEKNEYIEMLSNRRRLLPAIHSDDQASAARARRQAVNSVIQGSAADCIKLAMIAVDSAIRKTGFDASLVLQMHDELMYEVADDDNVCDKFKPIEFAKLLKTQMEDVSKHLKVILPVKVQTGKSWGDLHELPDI